MTESAPRQRITIAILALGGQGGGVLADWILDVAAQNQYLAQGTSVPGVAQRTGATVYYIELFPRPDNAGPEPILALMPLPGDVDIVIASELMEAGRAILRGFVSADRTVLIGSTHRVFSIGEKSAMGDGRASGERIIAAAEQRARRFICFDMDALAARSNSMISSVMLGALAASEALPFPREAFETAIRAGGKAIETNLAAFGAGFDAARGKVAPVPELPAAPLPSSETGHAMLQRIRDELPEPAQPFAVEGVRRLSDYQDHEYAMLYLDRLLRVRAGDQGDSDWRLTRETARYLALWMSYEDTIRVADLKVRASRFERVRDEVKAKAEQPLAITEYLHPRLQEVAETLPAGLGRRLLASKGLSRRLERLFTKGRHVRTSSLRWFAILSFLASLRRWRRGTLRYAEEQARIEAWLDLVVSAAASNPVAAAELVECQRLIKGYSETFERGLRNFNRVVGTWPAISGRPDAAIILQRLREAALADEESTTLEGAIAELRLAS
jgi:indolepyruvate ferredoxin oxidoreductase beta subunit